MASDKPERPTSEYSPAEIAIARALGRLRVDDDGYGWIRDMEPTDLSWDAGREAQAAHEYCSLYDAQLRGGDVVCSACLTRALQRAFAAGKRAGAAEMRERAASLPESFGNVIFADMIRALPLEPEGE